jgi:hypothetical protein
MLKIPPHLPDYICESIIRNDLFPVEVRILNVEG